MENNSIKKNAILNIIYNILNIVFPLITFPYVSRVLQVERLGNVSFFTTVANYAIMLASLGVNTYGIRAVSQVRDDKKKLSKTTAELLIINTIASIVVIVLLIGSSFFISKFSAEPVLLAINCALVFATPFGMNWLYSGLEQYGYITKRSIAVKGISLVLVFLFVKNSDDYCVYAAIIAFSTIGAYLLNLLYSQRFVSFKELPSLQYKSHFKPMMVLFASSLAISVYINLDTIMLGFISGDEQVGLYTVAVKVKSLLLIAVNAISTVLLPRLSYYLAEKRWDDFRRVLKKSVSTILMISTPLVALFILEAKDSILFLGGQEYLGATVCMMIIMPILVISGFSNITGNQILIPMGKENCFMKAVIAGAFVDLILNALLMPKWGCVGAAIATLIAECTQMSMQTYYSREYIAPSIQWKTVLHIIASTIVAVIGTGIIRSMISINDFVNLAISGISFFVIYGLSLLIMKDGLALVYLRDLTKRKL